MWDLQRLTATEILVTVKHHQQRISETPWATQSFLRQRISVVKNSPAKAGDTGDTGSIPALGRSPGEGMATHTPVFLPGEFHGQRSLACCSLQGRKESNTTQQPNDNNGFLTTGGLGHMDVCPSHPEKQSPRQVPSTGAASDRGQSQEDSCRKG